MSRSKNSRKGSKRGNWRCSCCHGVAHERKLVENRAKNEGRLPWEPGKHDTDNRHNCDW